MAYITTPGFAGISLTETSTEQKVPIGTEVTGSDGNAYMYVQGEMTANFPYIVREDGSSVIASTANSGATPNKIVVPEQGIDSGFFGWAIAKGLSFGLQVLANCAGDVKIYTNATRPDDNSSGADLIQGLRLNATNGGGAAEVNASCAGIMETNSQD